MITATRWAKAGDSLHDLSKRRTATSFAENAQWGLGFHFVHDASGSHPAAQLLCEGSFLFLAWLAGIFRIMLIVLECCIYSKLCDRF